MKVSIFLALALASAPGAHAADASDTSLAAITAHVQQVASTIGPHVPRSGTTPGISVIENAAAVASMADGRLRISTGLLGLLDSNAQLGMIVAYEMIRALPPEPRGRRDRSGSTSVGARIGRAATLGAVAGAVAYGVDDAMSGSSAVARGAATGAATAASTAAVSAAWSPRRTTKDAAKQDDAAAAGGMRAALAAGYNGHRALSAWDRLGAADAFGEKDDGSYSDRKANKKRRESAARVLETSRPPTAGSVVGADAYSIGILRHLSAWRLASIPPPPPAPDPAAPPVPAGGARSWLTYRRSGGITGWSVTVAIDDQGLVWATGSRRGSQPVQRRMDPADLAHLRSRVASALAYPARQGDTGLGSLRDGQRRTLDVLGNGETRQIILSDGYEFAPGDAELIRSLEDLATGG